MPDVRADPIASRRRRLRAMATGITLIGATAVLCSTVERFHDQVCEVRRLRARLAERRRAADRQRDEMAAVATAVEELSLSARTLESRVIEARDGGAWPDGGVVLPAPIIAPMPRMADEIAPATRAIATLAWVEEQIAEAGDVLAVRTTRDEDPAGGGRSVPTLWPVRGIVSSPFGWRRSPYGDGSEWHPGIDIRAASGTPVRATADGRVVVAGPNHSYGVLVILDHGASTSRYAHLSATWVHAGQMVHRGEPLGTVGGTGRATAPHLHFEVRIDGEPADPVCFLASRTGVSLARGESGSRSCALARAELAHRTSLVATKAVGVTTTRSRVGG